MQIELAFPVAYNFMVQAFGDQNGDCYWKDHRHGPRYTRNPYVGNVSRQSIEAKIAKRRQVHTSCLAADVSLRPSEEEVEVEHC